MSTFHFEVKELGQRLTDAELDELKRSRYGDARGRQATVAESPAQLLLEAVAAKQSASKKGPSGLQQSQPIKTSTDLVIPTVNQPITKPSETPAEEAKKNPISSNDSLNKAAVGRISSPVKQREYRRADGRKRIIPEALGVSSHQENISGTAQITDFSSLTLDHQKDDCRQIPIDNGVKEASFKKPFNDGTGMTGGTLKCNNFGSKERSGITARANIHESLVIEKAPAFTATTDGRMLVESSGLAGMPGSLTSCSVLSIRVFNKKDDDGSLPICLEAKPVERSMNDMIGVGNAFLTKETEITCTRGTLVLWSDRISGKVTVLAGNANFWAVGCEDGCLQVLSFNN